MANKDPLKQSALKAPKGFSNQGKYLKTAGSKFMKVLHALGSAGYGIRKGILAGLEGEPVLPAAAGEFKRAISAPLRREKDTEFASGSQILTKLGIAPEEPQTALGKAAKGLGGLAIDVATDPVTYATFGATLPEYLGGRASLTLGGKVMPQALKLSRTEVAERGGWALAKLGGLTTPQAVNIRAAMMMDKAGAALNALPGAELLRKTFTEGRMKVLAPYASKQKHKTIEAIDEGTPMYREAIKAQNLFREEVKSERAKESLLQRLVGNDDDAIRKVSDRIAKINEADIVVKQAPHIKKMRERQQMYQMIVDAFEGKPITGYKGRVRKVVERVMRRQGPLQKRMTEHEAKLLKALDPDHPGLERKIKSFLLAKDPATRADYIDGFRQNAEAYRRIVAKLDGDIRGIANVAKGMSGRTIEAANQFRKINKMVLGMVRSGGIPLSKLEGFMGRSLSQTAKERLGEFKMHEKAAKTFVKPLKQGNQRILDKFTRDQVEYFAADPIIRRVMFSKFGTKEFRDNPSFLDVLKGKPPTPSTFYQPDAMKELKHRIINASEAVSSVKISKELIDKFGLTPRQMAEADLRGIQYHRVDLPEDFQKLVGKKGEKIFMPEEIANEFDSFQRIINSPKALNRYLNIYDNVLGNWKRLTLFGVPFFPGVVMRNGLGGTFLSGMKPAGPKSAGGLEVGALSTRGANAAMGMTGASWKKTQAMGGKLPKEQWDAFKAKMDNTTISNADGSVKLSLGKEFDILEESGMFKQGQGLDTLSQPTTTASRRLLEKDTLLHKVTTGAGEASNQIAENLLRSQHYMTRRLQGYSVEEALMDMRDTQYDYMFGLSDFEREVSRRAAPFYSWVRFNVPAMIEGVLKQPGKATAVQKVVDEVEGTVFKPSDGEKPNEETLNEWVKGNMHIRMYKGKDGNFRYFVLKNWLPLADLEDVSSLQNIEDLFMGSLSPMAKIPLETMFNRSLFFREPGGERAMIERYPGETGEMLGVPIGRKTESAIRQALRPVKVVDTMNPMELFGKTGQQSWAGTVRQKATLTPAEKLGTMLGVKAIVVNQRRERELGRFAYQRKVGGLKAAEKKERAQGDVAGTARVQRLLQEIENQ